jgi:hypothetical protein
LLAIPTSLLHNLVVTKNRPERGEQVDISQLLGQRHAAFGEHVYQCTEIMRAGIIQAPDCHRSLEQFLNGLLSMKATRVVIDISVEQKPLQHDLVLFCFSNQHIRIVRRHRARDLPAELLARPCRVG